MGTRITGERSMPRSYGHGRSVRSARMLRKDSADVFGWMFPRLAKRKGCVLKPSPGNANRLERLGFEIGQKGQASQVSASKIPAGYTYWGQFIDHDITFDPTSSLQSKNRPQQVENFRTPRLDLDSVYGAGPAASPHLYDQQPPPGLSAGVRLLLGSNQSAGNGGPGNSPNPPTDFDVPRNTQGTALLGDPRNDENLIVSQLHHAFIKYHNAVAHHVANNGGKGLFEVARRLVRQHHQFAIRHDFLPTMCRPDVVNRVFANGPRFFRRRPIRMPVEFAVAAYRFGHSMVRDDYGVNDNFPNATMAQVFEFVRPPKIPVLSNWVVDFNRFFATPSNKPLNLARLIDTELAGELNRLPGTSSGSLMAQLAARNLVRGLRFGLPSGQCISRRMGFSPLSQEELLQGASGKEAAILEEKNRLLLRTTPLWYYVLKEAEVREAGNRLGRLGSTIVAEVFYRMLKDDRESYLNVKGGFGPCLPRKLGSTYTIVDLLEFAGVI